MTALSGWENFYVIVGSSAGALIGLQFVVITLIAQAPVTDLQRASSAFATPTIIHFGAVLLLSAILSAPWHGIAAAAIIWGLLGLLGLMYVAIVIRRIRAQAAYSPEFEDRLFHVLLPFAAYAGSAFAGRSNVWPRAVWRCRGGAVAALHRHSQRLGCRHLPRLLQKQASRSN
jgi:hypothetical protein